MTKPNVVAKLLLEISENVVKLKQFERLAELAAQLPEGLRADWRGTNSFELTTDGRAAEYFWLNLCDWAFFMTLDGCTSAHPEVLKRVGLLLDLAEEVSRLKPILEALEESND